MAKNAKWLTPVTQGVIGNAVYALLVLMVGGAVSYFSFITPQMGAALLKGFLASVLLLVATVAIRVWAAIPKATAPTTTENIEEKVRDWLFAYGLTFKNDPIEKAHFRLFVTTAGGKKIFVGRTRSAFDEYLTFAADLQASDEEKALAEQMTLEEKMQFVNELQLELCRAHVAYKGLDYLSGFSIEYLIPITPATGAVEFLNGLYKLESTINAALVIVRIARLRLVERMNSFVTVSTEQD